MGVTSSTSKSFFLKQDTSEIQLDKLASAEEITEFTGNHAGQNVGMKTSLEE